MAVWYCGSVQYAAIAQYANSTAYSVGNIVRQLATPAVNSERAFRCTTAGTSGGSEPSWTLTKGGTTNAGTAVFTEVTGDSAYGWAAAAPRLRLFANGGWSAAGDTTYVANDHAETATFQLWTWPGTAAAPSRIICVSASGSVPPVSADLAYTATATASSSTFTVSGKAYYSGLTFINSAAARTSICEAGGVAVLYRCAIRQTNNSAQVISFGLQNANVQSRVVLDNTTVEFGHASSSITVLGGLFTWKNTASAIVSGTLPTTLFTGVSTESSVVAVIDGVDLSALGSGKTIVGAQNGQSLYSLPNCRLGGSVTVAETPTLVGNRVSLEISDSGATGYRQEIYDYAGTLTTETTIVETGGASDGVQAISWKVVTTANAKQSQPFATFQIAQWNTATGSAKTATIEIVNDGTTLKNTEVWVEVEYLGSSSYPLASVVSSGADVLSAGSNISTSSVTWTTTGLSSPTKQYLQVSFTPQMVGYVRATVYVGKASQTLYIDPKMTIA